MSLVAFIFSTTLAAGQPIRPPPPPPETAAVAAQDRATVRCRPGPYLVAEQGEIGRERILVTGSHVPITSRDYPDRRPRPCMLMRDGEAPPNPLQSAD
jgi:hypothetical protein